MSLLVAQDVARRYEASEPLALDRVSLRVAPGEFVALAGPSGSGKSTLLAILAGLDRPDAGRVFYDGADLYARDTEALTRLRREAIGFVFQSHNLLPTLTALENVALAVRCKGGSAAGASTAAERALRRLGLGGKLARLPGRLSLGEQQRVAVARAIATRPKVLIADEPTASLDGAHGEQVLDALALLRDEGCAVVLASHDPRCLQRADRVCGLIDGRCV
jgi:putative ABC transport system ATP-binding protein